MRKVYLSFLCLFSGAFYSFAQMPAINNGLIISINGADAVINGDVYHQNDGIIHNSGNLHVTGNWENNNNGNNVFAPGLGGWVFLDGASQDISGTNYTLFNKLALAGTGIKQLQNTNALVEDTLALNDRELATGSNTIFVTGADVSLVTRTSGFVSSTDTGGLSRNTNSTGTYLFPVGSGSPSVKYRPAEIKPSSASPHTYKIRMADADPGAEGFDRSSKDSDSLCEINSSFYHRIYRTSGTSPADITVYFDNAADGDFERIAHWQNVPRWESTGNNSFLSGPPLASLTKSNWNDFSESPFALAKIAPVSTISTTAACKGNDAVFSAAPGFSTYVFFVNNSVVQSGPSDTYTSSTLNSGDQVGVVLYDTVSCPGDTATTAVLFNPDPVVLTSADDTTISLGQSATLNSSGALSYLWLPDNSSASSYIVSPSETTTYTVIGTDANGCKDTAEITVTVDADCVHMVPNIFSPNGDGRHEQLRVLGGGLEWINLSIYDRWGNKVFETSDISQGWDGVYKNKDMNSAVFVYILKGKCYSSVETFEQHGNITVTR